MRILRSSYFQLTIISVILFAGTVLFAQMAPPSMVSKRLLLIVPFFYLLSLLSNLLHERMKNNHASRVRLHYLVMSAIKMVIFIILLVIYGIFFRQDVVPFFISFLVFYLIYTFLDVRSFIRNFTR
jgi:hypothetical protein